MTKRIDPEAVCMHEAGTAASCEAVATRFHERLGQPTDEILCDAHAVGKKTEPLVGPSDPLHRVRAILRLWDQADVEANVAYYGDPRIGVRSQEEQTRLLHRLSYTERARRDLIRLYAHTTANRDPGEFAFRERLDRLRKERHSVQAMAVWMGVVIDDTLARLDGTIPLDAPVPDCTTSLATYSTREQTIEGAIPFFTALPKT